MAIYLRKRVAESQIQQLTAEPSPCDAAQRDYSASGKWENETSSAKHEDILLHTISWAQQLQKPGGLIEYL